MTLASRIAAPPMTSHEHVGFALGWDYAHYGLRPPAPYAEEDSPLHHGLAAGQAAFGTRTLQPGVAVRKWLQLRLHAWLRGRCVELVQVTPRYLEQLAVRHCPVTRAPLGDGTLDAADATIARVRHDAAYAAGNLAVMSAKARYAKAAYRTREALAIASRVESAGVGGAEGLSAAQWGRLAILCSFVEPLAHEQACALPLLVLPPNRLRLFNPVQALQAFVSRQLLTPGWSHRVSRLEELLPDPPARREFQAFFHALLPRVLEAAPQDTEHARWAVEDAWRHPLVLKRWTAFASRLTARQCEALVAKATARKLGALRIEQLRDDQATDGWNLETRGYVPHAFVSGRAAHAMAQSSLPL